MYQFSHIGLVVKNIEQSAEFYHKVLDCAWGESHSDDQLKIQVMMAGSLKIELLQFFKVEAGERLNGVVDHLCFQVTDIDLAVANLRAKGVQLLFPEPRVVGDGCKIIFFAGPDGERLEFFQEAKK